MVYSGLFQLFRGVQWVVPVVPWCAVGCSMVYRGLFHGVQWVVPVVPWCTVGCSSYSMVCSGLFHGVQNVVAHSSEII